MEPRVIYAGHHKPHYDLSHITGDDFHIDRGSNKFVSENIL